MTRLRLQPGEAFYLGYHEWAVHPDEAAVIVERGYVTVNGVRVSASKAGEINGYPVVKLRGLDAYGDPSDPQAPACSQIGQQLEDAA